jgi:hypothetical protein
VTQETTEGRAGVLVPLSAVKAIHAILGSLIEEAERDA